MLPKPLRVLIVEDHPDFLKALGMVLEMLGHHCELAGDAGLALAKARQDSFDLLMADVHLPGAHAWELIERLRAEQRLPPVVISMSTWDIGGELARSRAMGCVAHLNKPFKVEELEKLLRAIG